MPTVGVQVSAFTGDTGLSLWLYNAGTLLNAGGDALTETGSTGFFTANVAESLGSVNYNAVVRKSGAAVFEGILYSGQTLVGLVGSASSSGAGGATADAIEVVAGTTTLRVIVAFPGSDGGAVEPSVTPENDDWTLTKNGTELDYNVGYNLSLSAWGPCGQLLTVTMTTALAENDAIALCGAFTVSGQSQMFNARWVATGAATEANATANKNQIIADCNISVSVQPKVVKTSVQDLYRDDPHEKIRTYARKGYRKTHTIAFENSDGTPFDFSGMTLGIVYIVPKTEVELEHVTNVTVSENVLTWVTTAAGANVEARTALFDIYRQVGGERESIFDGTHEVSISAREET